MQSGDDIREELRMISAWVASIDRQATYRAPDGYFDDLSGRIMSAIEALVILADGEVGTDRLTRVNPYIVPQGYFEDFAANLLARIKAGQDGDSKEELAILSPLLGRIDKKPVYQIPEGYFSELTGNVLAGAQAIEFVNDELEQQTAAPAILPVAMPAKGLVVSIGKAGKWLTYAAAAAIVGLIVTGGWFGFRHPGKTTKPVTELASANSPSISKVSDDDLVDYLDNQNIPLAETTNNSTANLDLSDADVKNILGNVSDEELKQYLDDNGGTKDLVTN